ncbi:hypothetical protein BVX97_04260 [bacterium E08(2017)]|nr:hypothetical protein BVX97_04260 [bacterium E08(2017)]
MNFNTLFRLRFPVMMFLFMWMNINSGYWNLREFDTPMQMVHAFRGVMPYVLFPIGLFCYRLRPRLGGRLNPVNWLEGYGWIVLMASALSEYWVAAFYFGVAFLANIYVPQLFFQNWQEEEDERVLLYLTWIMLALFTLGIAAVARQSLFVGYSITGEYKAGVSGMAMSRSSGIARFFGASALLSCCKFWGTKTKIRWLWILPAGACAVIVWYMQSRGAMLGFAVGVLFMLLVGRTPKIVYVLIVIFVVGLYVGGYEKIIMKRVEQQLKRGQDQEQFESMSGRTKAYKKAWKVIAENPFIGQGNWADRLTIKEHVHNSYLQALMNGGIIGFIPYVISWVVGWRLFFLLARWRDMMRPIEKQLFLEASVIMAFFTVRSIPETTTASYSIASLTMVSVYMFMVVLYERLKLRLLEETGEQESDD